MEDKNKSIGFIYALNGCMEVFKSEMNFRLHVVSTIIVILAGIYFDISPLEWMLVIIVIGFVLAAELFNTAVEWIIDYMKPEIHPAAKKIKDASAGGVFIASLTALVIGIIVFIPKLL